MIEHPWSYLESYAKAGSDIIQIQAECYGMRAGHCQEWNKWPKEIESVDTVLLRQDLMRIRSYGKKAHVVFNPSTDVIEPVLDACDGVLIMSVNPGFAGQKFMPVALPKIARLKEIFKGDIEVDGGVNAQTAPDCVNAGAHVLITASYLFGAPDMRQAVNTLKAL